MSEEMIEKRDADLFDAVLYCIHFSIYDQADAKDVQSFLEVLEGNGYTVAPADPYGELSAYNPNERLREALVEARDQLWHLAKDPDDNYLIKRIDEALLPQGEDT